MISEVLKREGSPVSQIDPLELADAHEACCILGGESSPLHRSSLYRGMAAGIYPRPVKLGPGISRWLKIELREVIRQRAAERDHPRGRAS